MLATLIGERLDGLGTLEHPLDPPTFERALDVWATLQLVASAAPWEWSVRSTA